MPLSFTKPVKATYFDKTVSTSTSWQKIFVDLLSALYEDYSIAFNNIWGRVYPSSKAPLIGRKEDLRLFRKPKEFAAGMYIELNRSSNEIISTLKKILDICNLEYENVVISYTRKRTEHDNLVVDGKNEAFRENDLKVYQKLFSISKVYDDPAGLSLNKIMSMMGDTADISQVRTVLDNAPWAIKLSDEVYLFSSSRKTNCDIKEPSKSYLSITQNSVTDRKSTNYLHEQLGRAFKALKPEESTKKQPEDFDKVKFETTLLRRYRSGMQFDSIDFENFREMYYALYDETLSFDDEALEERLRYCGILYKDRLFPAEGIIDNSTKKTLFSYIDNCFSSGKSVLYYKAIYQDLSDSFATCFTLANEKMLKAYIEYSDTEGKYYYFSDYMSVDRTVEIDHSEEIGEYFLSIGKPARLDDAFKALSHIPQEQLDRIIKTDSHFLRNAKGEYFHTDIFEITDDELENIAEIINRFISEDEYAIWTDVWNAIQDKLPLFVENNLYLSGLGIRNAIAQRYSGKFCFEGAVISSPGDSFSMRDVYQLYAKHHTEFTEDEIYKLSKELDTVIYFDALAEVSVRVSHDLFVSKNLITFEVDSVDRVIDSFMSKDYIRVREIDSFLAFPYVGYEWNEYMLESFLISYSKKFMLLNNGQSLHNVAGAIVKKEGKIKEFEDACAAVLSESQIELKKSEALNYLADVDMITRRSYKDLDTAIRKATQIRNRKE